MKAVKLALSTVFDSIDLIKGLIPQALKDLIGPILNMIKKFKDTALGLLSQSGSYVSMAATGIDQLLGVVKSLSGEMAKMAGIDPSLINLVVNVLQGLTGPLHDLIRCVGALKDCFGLLKILGKAIRDVLRTVGTLTFLMPANIKGMIKLPIDALNKIPDQAEKCTP